MPPPKEGVFENFDPIIQAGLTQALSASVVGGPGRVRLLHEVARIAKGE